MAFPSQSGVAAGILGYPGGPGAPAIKATFDGSPEKLAFFLSQVWVHMDRYRLAYVDNATCVNAIMTNLGGKAAEWVTALHNEGDPKLGETDTFLRELRARFGDDT